MVGWDHPRTLSASSLWQLFLGMADVQVTAQKLNMWPLWLEWRSNDHCWPPWVPSNRGCLSTNSTVMLPRRIKRDLSTLASSNFTTQKSPISKRCVARSGLNSTNFYAILTGERTFTLKERVFLLSCPTLCYAAMLCCGHNLCSQGRRLFFLRDFPQLDGCNRPTHSASVSLAEKY